MKQFFKILRFELKNYLGNKVFVGVTIALVTLIAVVLNFPRFIEIFESKGGEVAVEKELLVLTGEYADEAEALFASAFADYDIKISKESLDSIKASVADGSVAGAFLLDGLTDFTYYVDNLSMYDANSVIATEALSELYRINAMAISGMTPEEIEAVMSIQITSNVETLGKNQMDNYFYTYIMVMALYMVIMLYGQMVATNVATEKSSRAMELLVTSANPSSMMFGKVTASCIAGLLQIISVFGSAILFYQLNREYWDGMAIIESIFDMPIELLLYMIVFFVLGFLIYAFLFGAVGSTVSKLEDINTSITPIMLVFIFGFMVVIFGMSSGDVDTVLMRAMSYIPFTSPMAMFTRIAMSTVPIWEILISVGILAVSVVGIGFLAAKIYRIGVLLYGTPPKLSAIIKVLRTK